MLIGVAKNANGDLFVVRSIVNQFDNELASMDVLYAINAKKIGLPHVQATVKNSNALAYSKAYQYNIADFIQDVNQIFDDTFSLDVYKHFNTKRRSNDFSQNLLYQDRDTDSMSTRNLLANALETTVQNDIERNRLAQYKQKIELIESEEARLHELREEIKELSFARGKRDGEKIRKLQFEKKQAENRINIYDRQLLTLEASKPLKAVLEREKKQAYKRAEQKGKEAVAKQRERQAQVTRELLDRATLSRKKAMISRNKTEMRHKIKKVVSDLNQLLLRPTKDKHIKEELQKAVAESLFIINMDTVGAEERIPAIITGAVILVF